MTPKELLRAINLPEDEFHLDWAKDTMDLAAVIERDTPKKPIKIAKGSAYGCPLCKSFVYIKSLTTKKAVCPECGQRLDWSEE